ncbi:MAG: T9SS type A sorting domain-containing protein [Candidatus Kapaibacterium sp.]|nr:T9SS type A sorting domain-containing protein [Bacteroidota bacterium]
MRLLILGLILIANAMYAGNAEIEMRMTLKNEFNKSYTVICGVDTKAGDSIDVSMGEFAFPNFPLDGFHAAYIVTDMGERVLSYKDIRNRKTDMNYTHEYKLAIPAPTDIRGKVIDITWAWPLPYNIDSITVTDEFEGLFVKFTLDKTEKFTLSDKSANLEKFNVKVYYNNKVVTVEEREEKVTLVPNPTEGLITGSVVCERIEVYNTLGDLLTYTTDTKTVNLSDKPSGTYIIRYFYQGKSASKIFVKL